jgi:hypothetical protein
MKRFFLLAGVTLSVALSGVVLVWFTTFSGFCQPVQFAYSAF